METRWGRNMNRLIIVAVVGALFLSGCSTAGQIATSAKQFVFGDRLPPDAPSLQKSAEKRWVLIKNPRYGSLASEPEYTWVEEDNIPLTVNTLIFGNKSVIAAPEIVAKYGSPPGGGKISPLQGGQYLKTTKGRDGAPAPSRAIQQTPFNHVVASPIPEESSGVTPRGYVIYVDQKRLVIDLTAQDGLKPGTIVSIRRDKIPVVHPVTGEYLGELDEDLGSAKIVELRERFSVAEIQDLAPGAQVKLKDRVIPRF
ncbi:MAG TPA: hypothetical protein VJO34_08475 [Methylomirabilota bacterium]|nr:hypothetical protein [Methylomirabilota bacterium]